MLDITPPPVIGTTVLCIVPEPVSDTSDQDAPPDPVVLIAVPDIVAVVVSSTSLNVNIETPPLAAVKELPIIVGANPKDMLFTDKEELVPGITGFNDGSAEFTDKVALVVEGVARAVPVTD